MRGAGVLCTGLRLRNHACRPHSPVQLNGRGSTICSQVVRISQKLTESRQVMAIPRKIAAVLPAPKLVCRQPQDFLGFQAAANKLADLQQRKAIKEVEWRALDGRPESDRASRIGLKARSLVDDVPVCVDIASDLRALREELETFDLATEMATRKLNNERQAMAREVSKDLAPTHKALLRDFFEKQDQAIAVYDAIRAFSGAAITLVGCEVLPEYWMDPYKFLVYRTGFELFKNSSADYLKEVK
jgi:hypothetical protein